MRVEVKLERNGIRWSDYFIIIFGIFRNKIKVSQLGNAWVFGEFLAQEIRVSYTVGVELP